MQLRGCPSARLGVATRGQPQASSRRSVACSFFGNKRAGPNNNFSRQQYEQAIGNLLQTVSSPAPPPTESVPPSGATAQPVVHDGQNGQAMHVVKPEKAVDVTHVELESQAVEDSHAAEASTTQTEAAAALKAEIEKEAAVQFALKAELAAAAAKAALQQQLEAAAAAAAAAAADSNDTTSQASPPPSAEELVKADTATGKLQQQLHQNKDALAADQQQNKEAAAQEGRVLKPAAARTEPKTPGAKGSKVPQAANPRNLVFVTAEVRLSRKHTHGSLRPGDCEVDSTARRVLLGCALPHAESASAVHLCHTSHLACSLTCLCSLTSLHHPTHAA